MRQLQPKRDYPRAGRVINGGLPLEQAPCLRFLVAAPVVGWIAATYRPHCEAVA